jgi:antitoxin HigA-1
MRIGRNLGQVTEMTSVLTTNGESVSVGGMVMPMTWKSSIIIRRRKTMKRDMPPVYPGEILLEDFLKPMGITQYRLAKSINVSHRRIGEIVAGRRAITADTALRLALYFGTDAQSWMNLQTHYDLAVAEGKLSGKPAKEVVGRAA